MLGKLIGKDSTIMKMLVREELVTKKDQEHVQGYVYIKSYSELPTKNGGTYIGGNLEAKGSMQFKIWSNAPCYTEMVNNNYADTICMVDARVNVYSGMYSLVIESCRAVEDGSSEYSASDFFEERYNSDNYWNNLCNTLKKHLSDKAYEVFNLVVSGNVREAFMTEFAAVSHHDACASGLLAHTAKVVKLATVIKIYPEVLRIVSSDLLFLGCALHDIGKTREYFNGSITEEGKRISHLTSGILILEQHREKIVELMGEVFYSELLSVVAQHHGEYGEYPRTIAAVVINQIDCLDATMTTLNESLVSVERGSQIIWDGHKVI